MGAKVNETILFILTSLQTLLEIEIVDDNICVEYVIFSGFVETQRMGLEKLLLRTIDITRHTTKKLSHTNKSKCPALYEVGVHDRIEDVSSAVTVNR